MVKAADRQVIKILGENIRSLRISRGYSQAGFAKLFGITQAAVCLIEKGERDPGLDFVFMIADQFKIPISSLIPFDQSGLDDDIAVIASDLVHKNAEWKHAFNKARYLSDHETDLVIRTIECLAKGDKPDE